jgi:hypothetical protein
MTWTFILQIEASGRSECRRYLVPALSRPVRLLIAAEDSGADAIANQLFSAIDQEMQSAGAAMTLCGPANVPSCRATREPRCEHILVAIVGAAPVPPAIERLCLNWPNMPSHVRTRVLPTLLPNLAHARVFTGSPASLKRLQTVAWQHSVVRLCGVVLAAVWDGGARRSLFVSYRRADAAPLVDVLFENPRAARLRLLCRPLRRPAQAPGG